MAARGTSAPVLGAVFTVLIGLVLWSDLGESWKNASYDYLFRFGTRSATNKVVLILMDNTSYQEYDLQRSNPWPRRLHTELLERLTQDACPLVVMDTFLKKRETRTTNEANEDRDLAEAICKQRRVLLRAKDKEPNFEHVDAAALDEPDPLFCQVAAGWGIASVADEPIVRWIWHVPHEETNFCSLPWKAATMYLGKHLSTPAETQWLRYYREKGGWTELSYCLATNQPPGYFSDKIVFIGNDPHTRQLGDEDDEFATPYTRWNSESSGGVKILATTFLNLANGEWLRRPPVWAEFLALTVAGVSLGLGFHRLATCQGLTFGLRIGTTCTVALLVSMATLCGAAMASVYTNYWFPWLVIAGGQVPFALAWSCVCAIRVPIDPILELEGTTTKLAEPAEAYPPRVHGYEYLTKTPFGEGAFGTVWIVRSVIGELNALKIVPQHASGEKSWYGQAEFKGIQKYKPISNNHAGLLHVLHIDRITKPDGSGYFYYVMELGDSLEPGWEANPASYRPANLNNLRFQVESHRLPVSRCIEVMLPLTEALDFLHRQSLTHRDIKPENIVFVGGCPKLADVGLVTHLRTGEETVSRPGTPGYMPPPPEPVGTVAADIYALGMVLYVISTGRKPDAFPMIKTTLMESSGRADFMQLDAIIVKATQPDPKERYQSAAEMHAALISAQSALGVVPSLDCSAAQS